MITRRKSEERGHFQSDWLDSYHTFSFDTYYDPRHTNFRTLRVINEDRVNPGHGFPLHPHRDMEILTFVIEGTLSHRDSMGGKADIGPGEVQRITAGAGIEHSESNMSTKQSVHLLQIWILPAEKGLPPSYEIRRFDREGRRNQLQLIASAEAREDSVLWHQDVSLYASLLEQGKELTFRLADTRHAWVQMIRGSLALNGLNLTTGDGAAVSEENLLTLAANEESEFLLFDLN
jgi:quercetin 2,3-dioxygenase